MLPEIEEQNAFTVRNTVTVLQIAQNANKIKFQLTSVIIVEATSIL